MRQKHLLPSIVIILSLLNMVAFSSSVTGEEKLDTAEILAVATGTFKVDQRKLTTARLKGRFEISGKDGKVDTRLFTTFECWVWGDMLRNNSRCDLERSTFPYAWYEETRTLLLDDRSLYVTSFSDRFKPVGCQTRILRSDSEAKLNLLFDTHYTVWHHPTTILSLPFAPTRDELETMTFTKDNNGILHGIWHRTKGVRFEVQLDSRIGNRAIAQRIYVKDKLSHDIRATWKPWANGGMMLESVEHTNAVQNATYRWTLTEFDSLKAAPANKFQPDDLGALPGSRVIDTRDPDNILLNRQPKR